MSQVDARKYNISVRWGKFEDESCYEARIKELPSIAEYADTQEEAYALAIDAIETLAELYAEQGKVLPDPEGQEESDYSGRITLRMPRTLHQGIAETADYEGVSLNTLIVSALSAYVGFGTKFQHTQKKWHNLSAVDNFQSGSAEIHEFSDYQNQPAVND